MDIFVGEFYGWWFFGLFDILFYYYREYEGRSGDIENTEGEGYLVIVYRIEEGV